MKKIFKTLIGGVIGGGLLGLGGKKKKQAIAPIPTATRDDAMTAVDDELLRRRGGAADILTGATGAEAALSGGKLVLGS